MSASVDKRICQIEQDGNSERTRLNQNRISPTGIRKSDVVLSYSFAETSHGAGAALGGTRCRHDC